MNHPSDIQSLTSFSSDPNRCCTSDPHRCTNPNTSSSLFASSKHRSSSSPFFCLVRAADHGCANVRRVALGRSVRFPEGSVSRFPRESLWGEALELTHICIGRFGRYDFYVGSTGIAATPIPKNTLVPGVLVPISRRAPLPTQDEATRGLIS